MIDEKTYSLAEIEEQTGFDRRTISYYVQQGLLPKVGRRGPKTRYSQVFFNRLALIRMIRELQDRGAMGSMTLSDIRDLFQSAPDKLIADVVNGKETLDGIDDRFQAKSRDMAPPSERRSLLARRAARLRRATTDGAVSTGAETMGMPMDPAEEPAPNVEAEETFAERAYLSLPTSPQTAEERETPSGEYHRLTLEALERAPGTPIPQRKSPPAPPLEDELREALARLHAVVKRQPRAYLRTTETWTRARITEELIFSARGLDERHLPLIERVAAILRRLMREEEGGF